MQDEENNIEDIILNLKIISKIKQHEKLIVVNKTLTVDHRFAQPLFRWYSSDNRKDTLDFITVMINNGLDLVQQTAHPVFDKETIKQELLATIEGIDNLSATYKLDNHVVAKIDLLRDKIHRICDPI